MPTPRPTRRSFLAGSFAGVALVVARGLPATAQASRWTHLEIDPAPAPRADHALVYDYNGIVYLFGGRGPGGVLGDLWALDIAAETWTEMTGTGPSPRFTPNAGFDSRRGRVVVAMGQGDGFFNDLWAYDIASGQWFELGTDSAQRPRRRYGAGSAFDRSGDRLFVSHGFTDHGRFDDTWTFDLATETWTRSVTTGAVPLARCLVQAAWDPRRGELLLFAGQSDPDPVRRDFWVLKESRGAWIRRRPDRLPPARNLYGADFDESKARWFVFGGDGDDGALGDLWRYRSADRAWARAGRGTPRPGPRRGAQICVAGDKLVVFGGETATDVLGDTWVLAL